MAVDAALLASVQAGGPPVIRLYRWSPPCLSFGRNQPTRGLYDLARARSVGIDFVRRPTGGQAVLHDDELTYAVVAPAAMIGRPRAAYRRINEALVAGLRTLGLPAAVAPAVSGPDDASGTRSPVVPWTEACFRRPAPGEVVVGPRKLVGSAQRTEGRAILQHGSVLVGGSQGAAEDLLEGAGSAASIVAVSGAPGWTTIEAELGSRPAWAELAKALVAGFEMVLGTSLAPSTLSPQEMKGAAGLRERFASDEWTWRR
jgi:lipoyl(octanoyl) transferase